MDGTVLGPKIQIAAPGPSKKLPERCVYEGFCAGGSRVAFWARNSAFGLQNPKMGRISCFGAKKGKPAPQKGECTFLVKYFLANTNGSDMSEIMIFLEISLLSWNFNFFMESAEKVFYFFQKYHVSHPRGRLPRMLFKLMKYYTFWGVLGAMGSLFEKKCGFFEILGKCKNVEKS